MTPEELAACDGRDGRRACVAVNGKVYDFTTSEWWTQGDHQGRHRAGGDLTEELRGAPHVRAVIERFPVVGDLEPPPAPPRRKGPLLVFLAVGAALVILAVLLLL